MSNNIGVITEQGDLGLGFNEISNKDQRTVNEHYSEERKNAENKGVSKDDK